MAISIAALSVAGCSTPGQPAATPTAAPTWTLPSLPVPPPHSASTPPTPSPPARPRTAQPSSTIHALPAQTTTTTPNTTTPPTVHDNHITPDGTPPHTHLPLTLPGEHNELTIGVLPGTMPHSHIVAVWVWLGQQLGYQVTIRTYPDHHTAHTDLHNRNTLSVWTGGTPPELTRALRDNQPNTRVRAIAQIPGTDPPLDVLWNQDNQPIYWPWAEAIHALNHHPDLWGQLADIAPTHAAEHAQQIAPMLLAEALEAWRTQ